MRAYKKNRDYLTTEQIVGIYLGLLEVPGFPRRRIRATVDSYLSKEPKLRVRHTYARATRLIRRELDQRSQTVDPIPTVTLSEPDPYAKLEKAQTMMTEAIVEIAELEANKRSEAKLADLKKHYKEELAKLQAILVEAKQSSVVGVLKKHFNNL